MEIMVVMSVVFVIGYLAYLFFSTGYRVSRFESEQETAIRYARKAIEIVEKDIRMISDSALGAYAIESAFEQELIIYSDIIDDGDNLNEKIRFSIDSSSNELKKNTTKFSTSTMQYDNFLGTTTISRYVNNQTEPLFYYYDNNGATTTLIRDIRRVRFRIKINVTPTIAPNDYYVESDITLRNIKDNL